MIGPEHEQRRRGAGDAFTDAVTFSFADARAGWFGLVRLGLSAGGGSALAVLIRGREPAGAIAEGGIATPEDAGWDSLSLGPARTTVEVPLERWTVAVEGDGFALDLRAEAASSPCRCPALGGMEGYEQLCRFEGTVRAGSETARLQALGQRGHSWGAPDWSRIDATRSVSAWLEDDAGGIALAAVRPAGARTHADEQVWAAVVRGGDPVDVDEPRLSTTYDADGRQCRAGLELWMGGDDEYPVRAAGEALCGTTLDLGALRLELAFLRWHAEGHEGVGRYDIVRRAS